jgi:NDP-sugar pyrophosphorylase family protein
MKAMVLAAGVGSRLRPLTDECPKALVEIGGMPMVEIVLRRLAAVGVREVVVNVFHHADKLESFLAGRRDLGLRIHISHEDELLDTGGGLKQAAAFLAGAEPFFLHNADVVSGVDLLRLLHAHRAGAALATLSVRDRPASRRLLFDARGRLCGWERADTGERTWAGAPREPAQRLGFDGIQVLSPDIFAKLTETGAFSLTRAYLRLASEGERIEAFRADDYYWADIGSLSKLQAVRQHVEQHGLPL